MSHRTGVLLAVLGLVVFCVCVAVGLAAVGLLSTRTFSLPGEGLRPVATVLPAGSGTVAASPSASPTATTTPTPSVTEAPVSATSTVAAAQTPTTRSATETAIPPPVATTAAAAPTRAATVASSVCHPSYPDFCIPAPPPPLNCTSVRFLPGFRAGFTVRHDVANPDPHNFDPDRDGRGCP